MATVTRRFAEFRGGLVVAEIDYDDKTLVVQRTRVVNASLQPLRVTVSRPEDASVAAAISHDFEFGSGEKAFPQTGVEQFTLIPSLGRGLVAGVDIACMWPAPKEAARGD